MKESERRYKLRQSLANLRKMEKVKEKYQTAFLRQNSSNINLIQNS